MSKIANQMDFYAEAVIDYHKIENLILSSGSKMETFIHTIFLVILELWIKCKQSKLKLLKCVKVKS
jgi:hypothetical protein